MRKIHELREQGRKAVAGAYAKAACMKGQGTTEYAILVGVLVVTNTIHWRYYAKG